MTRIGLIAALAVVSAASAYAQMQPVDPPVTRSLPESSMEPPIQLVQTPPWSPIKNELRHERDADARRCLELPTNRQVHRCAERYRSRASRAGSVVKASSKPAAAAKVSDMVQPPIDAPASKSKGGPRAGDLEKAADLVKPMDVTKPGGTPKAVEIAPKAAEPAKAPAPPATAAKAPAADTTKATAPAKTVEPAKK